MLPIDDQEELVLIDPLCDLWVPIRWVFSNMLSIQLHSLADGLLCDSVVDEFIAGGEHRCDARSRGPAADVERILHRADSAALRAVQRSAVVSCAAIANKEQQKNEVRVESSRSHNYSCPTSR